MTLVAFILIVLSVGLHVTWNMLSKSVRPSLAFCSFMALAAALATLPVLWLGGFPFVQLPLAFYGLLLASGICETVYMYGLAGAYRRGDISLVYPAARTLPVLIIAVISLMFGFGKSPGVLAFAGMAVLTLGCLVMPFAAFDRIDFSRYFAGPVKYILLAAAGTAGYTLIDYEALRILKNFGGDGIVGALGYLCLIECLMVTMETFLVWRDSRERKLWLAFLCRPVYPVLAGLCSAGAYWLILLAMKHVDNVTYIQCFRQLSLPLGFLAGVLVLKEAPSLPKIAGLLLVILGLLLTVI